MKILLEITIDTAKNMAYIINILIEKGVYRDQFKNTELIPIYKNGIRDINI